MDEILAVEAYEALAWDGVKEKDYKGGGGNLGWLICSLSWFNGDYMSTNLSKYKL